MILLGLRSSNMEAQVFMATLLHPNEPPARTRPSDAKMIDGIITGRAKNIEVIDPAISAIRTAPHFRIKKTVSGLAIKFPKGSPSNNNPNCAELRWKFSLT